MSGIPHFLILYGGPGCGKSAYAEALANKLGYDMLDVDFGQTGGGLVGQTETWSRALIESFKKMSNATSAGISQSACWMAPVSGSDTVLSHSPSFCLCLSVTLPTLRL